MQKMVDTVGGRNSVGRFLQSRRAGEVTSAEGKQQVIAELYEKFFRIGFKKQAEALGSYTPVEVGLHCGRLTFASRVTGRGLTDEGLTASRRRAHSLPGCCS